MSSGTAGKVAGLSSAPGAVFASSVPI